MKNGNYEDKSCSSGFPRTRAIRTAAQSCSSIRRIWYDSFHVAFDRSGKLWKIFQWQWKWTETIPPPWDKYNKGVNTVTWQAVNDIDVQNNRGTIINAFGDGFPDVSSDLPIYQKRFDINRLEEVHR